MKANIRSAILASCVLAVFCCVASATTTIKPIMMSNRSLGGADLNSYTLGVTPGYGPNNIGLLVRTWGKVTYVDAVDGCFYVDDGSKLSDGTRRPDNSLVLGVRVTYTGLADGVPAITPPAENSYVALTGISSTVVLSGVTRPNLRVRKSTDIVPFP